MATAFHDGLLLSALIGIALSFSIIYLSPQIAKRFNIPNSEEFQPCGHGGSHMNPAETSPSRGAKKLVSIFGVSNAELERSLREEVAVRKSKKIQRVLGCSEVDVREAVRGFEMNRSDVEEVIVQKTRKLQRVLGMQEYEVREAVRSQPPPQSLNNNDYVERNAKSFNREREERGGHELDAPVNWFKILDGFVIFILIAVFCYFFNFSTNGDFGRVLVGLFPREFKALGLKEYLERMSPTDPRLTDALL